MLLDLPTETLLSILKLSLPYDFESLALACKTAYQVATPFLSRHNGLRRKYRRVAFPERNDAHAHNSDMSITAVPQLLLSIARDPIIAEYIVQLDARDASPNEYPNWSLANEGLDSASARCLVAPLVEGSQHLRSLGLSLEGWTANVVREEGPDPDPPDYGTAFLLSLLPNLESLALPWHWTPVTVDPVVEEWEDELEEPGHEVSQLVQSLVSRANDVKLAGQPLSRLRVLQPTCPDVETSMQLGIHLKTIMPFLSLRSLREVYHLLGVLERSSSIEPLYKPLGPNVEILELYDCWIGEEFSQLLFENMENLRVLKIGYQMKDDNIFMSHMCQTPLDVVAAACGRHLEVLSLTLGWEVGVWGLAKPIRNLSEFKSLREVELDTALFWENDWGAEESVKGGEGNEDEDTGIKSKDNAKDKETDDKGGDDDEDEDEDEQNDTPRGCPSLVSLLRSSLDTLEQITLHVPAQKGDLICLKRLLKGIPNPNSQEEKTKKRLPKLTQLKVVLYYMDHRVDKPEDADELVARARRVLRRFEGIVVEEVPADSVLYLWPSDNWSGPSGSVAAR